MKRQFTWTISYPIAAVIHAQTADAAATVLNEALDAIGCRPTILSSHLALLAPRSVPHVRILRGEPR